MGNRGKLFRETETKASWEKLRSCSQNFAHVLWNWLRWGVFLHKAQDYVVTLHQHKNRGTVDVPTIFGSPSGVIHGPKVTEPLSFCRAISATISSPAFCKKEFGCDLVTSSQDFSSYYISYWNSRISLYNSVYTYILYKHVLRPLWPLHFLSLPPFSKIHKVSQIATTLPRDLCIRGHLPRLPGMHSLKICLSQDIHRILILTILLR